LEDVERMARGFVVRDQGGSQAMWVLERLFEDVEGMGFIVRDQGGIQSRWVFEVAFLS